MAKPQTKPAEARNIIIMGAAGRDFHNFNVFFRDNKNYVVKAFTAAQLPNISRRRYPKELAGKSYPKGIPIYDEEKLPGLIKTFEADIVVLAYSDLFYSDVTGKASIALSQGADFWLMGPESTQIISRKPVVAVCATRTGAGKTTVARKTAEIIRDMGETPVIIRHPMPYGDLKKQIVQRFETDQDLERHACTIEEREEYEPYLEEGFVVYAGVDYERVLRAAEKEADVIVYEGGNNDFPLIKPNLLITVADPLRAGHEIISYPGEINARMADIIVINKVNTATKRDVEMVERNIRAINKKGKNARIIRANSIITVDRTELIRGKRVIVVEDGPTVTHGGLKCSAGCLAASKYGAKIIDANPSLAIKSISKAIMRYGLKVIPALGYGKMQMKELESSINRTAARMKCDAVLLGTSSNLTNYIKISKPVARVRYELEEIGQGLESLIKAKLARKNKI